MDESDTHIEVAGTVRLLNDHDSILLIPEPTNSPNDPLNWSAVRKYWHATLILFITGFTAATSNDAGSASDAMLEELDISYGVQNTAAGVLFIGIGYWCLLGSPLTSLYGRKIQYIICLVFSLIGAIWFAETKTRQHAIWCQLFVGASEACAEAVAQQSLSDLFYQHQRGTVLGIYVMATSTGTFLGPLVGGYIAADNWRWVGWAAAIITGITLIVFVVGLEETVFDRSVLVGTAVEPTHVESFDAGGTILDTKPSSIPAIAGEKMREEARTETEYTRKTYWQRVALITPARNLIGVGFKQYLHRLGSTIKLFRFPAIIFAGLQWGAQDAWLTFYLTVEEDNWYEAPWYYGNSAVAIMNVPTLIGALIGCVYGGWFSDVFVRWRASRRPGGISEAEDRLWLLLLSAIVSPAGLMLFGIASDKGWNWPAPYVGLGFIGFGWGCAGDLSMAYLMDCYPEIVLEGMVGVAVINNTLACILTFVCSYWIDASGLTRTFVAIGILSFVIQLGTLPMIYWGKSMRIKTSHLYRQFLSVRDG